MSVQHTEFSPTKAPARSFGKSWAAADSDLPPAAFLDWWEDSPFLAEGRLMGRSLKYLRSLLPTLLMQLPDPAFEELSAHLKAGGSLGGVTDWKETSEGIRLQLSQTTDYGKPRTLRILSETGRRESARKHELSFSFEELHFSLEDRRWQGPAQALLDLEANTLSEPTEGAWPKPPIGPKAVLGSILLSAQLDMKLPDELWELLEDSYDEAALASLSQRQLGKIFKKLMLSRKPSRAFIIMQQLGILDWFLPELARGVGLEQNRYHLHDIFYHLIYTCDAVETPDLGLRLAALFHDLGKVDTRREKGNGEASFHNHELVSVKHAKRILYRFGLAYNKPLYERVIFLVRNHMFHYTQEWTDKAIRRFVRKIGTHQLDDLIALRLADRKGSGKKTALPRAIKEMIRHIEEVRRQEAELKVKDLRFGGHDLMQLGLKPGPVMGDILAQLLEEVKSGELENDFPSLQKRSREIILALSPQESQTSSII